MHKLTISAQQKDILGTIELTASKSESNRVLLIKALCTQQFNIHNLAAAKDTDTMVQLLTHNGNTKDVGPAGTTMRFLTAYYANTPGEWVMTGSERMQNRPIHILVNALKSLGAEINYLNKEGCPPLVIKGKQLTGGKIEIDGSVSSQFLSALIMIAPCLKGGLEMQLTGKIASIPYLNMTLKLINEFGIHFTWEDNIIKIEEGNYVAKDFTIEADWSAASYWYQLAAFADTAKIHIKGLKDKSLQGDRAIVAIYAQLGVKSTFTNEGVLLEKTMNVTYPKYFEYDFSDCPDVAQTVAATVAALKIPAHFKGLESLRIKETDRIEAIQKELGKFGAKINNLPNDEIELLPSNLIQPKESIATYDDHRVAMSIAPLALFLQQEIVIEEPQVVEKSYPDFWSDLTSVGMVIK